MKPILIASDHAGFDLKEALKQELASLKVPFSDMGTHSKESVDYPDFGNAVAQKIGSGESQRGIIVCGTGIGISIAANRFPGVRAALCTSVEMAELSRKHNDANVLALGGRTTPVELAKDIMRIWLITPFEGGHHQQRVDKLGVSRGSALQAEDPDIYGSIQKELRRQDDHLELIASENITSPAVMEACGSALTNKYAEGYPGKRYYGGCANADDVERLAIERAKKLFNAGFANVQPHSGSQANFAVFFSLLSPGDTVLGLDLSHGGHLTHGSKVNFSGKMFKAVGYTVHREKHTVDFNELAALARKHKPRLIIAGASAYPRILEFDKFRAVADEVGAYLLADVAHIAGLIAAGLHPNPLPHAHVVTTTTHKTLRGPRGGMILANDEKIAHLVDKAIFPGIQGGPLVHIIAGKAVAFKEALEPAFKEYQEQVLANAQTLARELQKRGFTLISGGTDNHLMLVDLRSKNITGAEAESALERAGIVVNKNTIPFDTQKPAITSGIRIGTPTLTTRGMKEQEMRLVADFIGQVLNNPSNSSLAEDIRTRVLGLCRQFPVYP